MILEARPGGGCKKLGPHTKAMIYGVSRKLWVEQFSGAFAKGVDDVGALMGVPETTWFLAPPLENPTLVQTQTLCCSFRFPSMCFEQP